MDRRRRQYVPISVRFASGATGTNLRRRFGRDGVYCWLAFLASCKENWTQGEISFADESEGWMRLGVYPGDPRPGFTLDDFFRYTGELHLTARRRSGDLLTIVCRPWDDWNTMVKREQDAERMSRKRQENTATPERQPDDSISTEVEVEGYVEKEVEGRVDDDIPLNPRSNGRATARAEQYVRRTGFHLTDSSLLAELEDQDVPEPDREPLLELARSLRP